MLGERRSNSLFAPAAPAEPERKPEQAEVHDISFEERTGRSLFAETATAPRASELFFAPQEKGVTFAEALSQVQSYLSETYAIRLWGKLFSSRSSIIEETLTVPSHFWKPWANIRLKT